MSKFVFVLAPPYSGSTVLFRLLDTSAHVSALPGEGQFVEDVTAEMRAAPWDETKPLNWGRIREAWEPYWDNSKPLHLEKSPPNMIRAAAIEEAFDPAHFIVMMREPYAHIEGLARRGHVPPMGLPKSAPRLERIARAAELWLEFAATQRKTISERRHVTWFTYEGLTQEAPRIATQLKSFLPELGNLDIEARFGVHAVSGTTARELQDMNAPKRALLQAADFEIISDILRPQEDLLKFFGYRLRDAAPNQDWVARRATFKNTMARAGSNIVKWLPGRGKN